MEGASIQALCNGSMVTECGNKSAAMNVRALLTWHSKAKAWSWQIIAAVASTGNRSLGALQTWWLQSHHDHEACDS